MCDHCVIESVRERMLSRRDLFSVAAGAAAAAAVTAPPAMAGAHGGAVDMTYTLDGAFPTWSGPPGIIISELARFSDSGLNAKLLTIGEHTGTHVDAPLHFSADGQSVDEIPVENLVCPLCVIDIREKAAAEDDATVTPDDLTAWIAAHGPIPDGACVAMNSGWQAHVTTSKFRNIDDNGVQHYPGFHIEAVQMLIEETGAVGLAADTLSLDIGASQTFETHYAWLPTNRWGIENIANIDAVPAAGATLVVGAPKHRGGSGGPARVIALV
ncbi:MAG: cyclase family protein [Pseudomonadota bacterium]